MILCSVKSPLKVAKDWKEKFFCPANQVREEEPKKARENNDALIIEDWVSDDEDDVEPIPKVEKKTVIPTATKKEFVKPETPVRRSVRQNVNTVKARGFNAVKPSACWVWKPIKSNGASLGYVTFGGVAKWRRTGFTAKDCLLKDCEWDQTCVAVLKACNTELFVKTWPLVPLLSHFTDDYIRFSWVFFLRTKDETSEILKNFIKEVENLMDKKVKIIISDNGTDFKNKVMDEFCREKGIKREYSVARTPQQNGVAERKNRTLIEAARTMLADSKLPTTFWAEAVSTACYVQNRVLIVKPHNKTPYESLEVLKTSYSFMKPLLGMSCYYSQNYLDKLGKFDGKSDEGFFVGYSLSSKAFRVYNIRTRKVQENLHIGFLENKPMIEGNGPKWLFNLDSQTQSMNYVPVVARTFSNDFAGITRVSEVEHIFSTRSGWIAMPIWKDASYFGDASPNIVDDAQIEDKDELHDEDDATEEQEVNTGSREVSTALPEVNTATPEDLVGPSPASEDSHMEDQEIELGNIPQSYEVPTTPHIRIHKDHPIEHVIGDVQSSVQTRRMKTSYSEKGFLSAIYEGKSHQDLHTCLFEELLQFKLQKVWILVDLPKGHRIIGTKWVYRNKKVERGIVIRNKARLVAQGHTQEEGIDYDEVFALVARIEAIKIFQTYASYMGFIVYQMDAKSAFLYGQIEEEVYVCEPPGFEDPHHPNKVYKVQQKKKGIFISQDKYVHEILRKFNYSDVKSASTPTDLEKPLVQDGDAADVDEHLYRSMIGSLMYLTAFRPNIMFAIYACARCRSLDFKEVPVELVASH
ncbi:hypothetical protein Tco_1301538 [Tanacetum coccineum]